LKSINSSIIAILFVALLAACGGGSTTTATAPAPPLAPAPVPAPGPLIACTHANFTMEKFLAIAEGMTLTQVSQVIGCSAHSIELTPDVVGYIGWAFEYSGIGVYFDPTGTIVTAVGGDFKHAFGLVNPITPTTAACSQTNFTLANVNAISVGMNLAQVSQTIGCQVNYSTAWPSHIVYGWVSGDSSIFAFFDRTGTKVTYFGSKFKGANGLANPTTPTTAACTQANFTIANFNAIFVGMNLAQVSQAIGCQVSSNLFNYPPPFSYSGGYRTDHFYDAPISITYTWRYGRSYIEVDFDPTGTAVTFIALPAGLANPTTPTTTACTEANFTQAKFNAISVGMSLAQVSQIIGCQASSNVILRDAILYYWANGNSLIDVYFDVTGTTVISIRDQFKDAIGLTNPTTLTTAACTRENITVTNFNAITVGMTLAQVSQVIGCQVTQVIGNHVVTDFATQSYIKYIWSSHLNSYDNHSITVYFDSTGAAVTPIGGTWKQLLLPAP
jgi:hypothetical protein